MKVTDVGKQSEEVERAKSIVFGGFVRNFASTNKTYIYNSNIIINKQTKKRS